MEKNSEIISLDEIDLKIVAILEENSKKGTKELAQEVGLTVTPTFERIRRLERRGVIKGYVAKIDQAKIGRNLLVFCQVSLKTHTTELLENFEKQVVELKEVEACFHIAGNYDYLLQARIHDMQEYQFFLKSKLAAIPNIANVQSSFVMTTLKIS
ncbi:MAG: Lrp/AsnC family transcriptional regulator [Flavobacteriia bacterium]|jgi:Lrp/AsnC family leucine-responsive transcriptional regulator